MTSINHLAVAYERLSDDDSGKAASVERQRNRNVELAERRRITIERHFCDNSKSASQRLDERSEYLAMLKRIDRGDVRYVLAWHPDRLHRNVADAEKFIQLCVKHGIVVVTESAGDFDFSKAYARKNFRDAVSNATYESEHRGERVAEARRDQAIEGRYGGGVRPYGWGVLTYTPQYRPDKRRGQMMREPDRLDDDGRPMWVDMTQHNPNEAREIQAMAAKVLAGVPIAEIIRDLKARGVPTQREADNRVITKKGKETGHRGWNSRTIKHALTSPRTAGHSVYQGTIIARGVYEAILTDDQQHDLLVKLDDPTRRTSPGNSPKWLVSTFAICGRCDEATMTVRKRTDGLPVYRCRSGHNSRDAEALDEYVQLRLLNDVKRHGADLIATPVHGVDVEALRRESRQIDQRVKGLLRRQVDGLIDDGDLDEALIRAKRRKREIADEIAEGEKNAHSPLGQLVTAQDALAHWERLSIGERRAVVREAYRVTVLPGKTRQVNADTIRLERW